jgi:hypothetical protein
MQITYLASKELLLWIAIEVICERHWHAVDEWKNAVQISTFFVVPLQPRQFVRCEARFFS